MIFGCTCGVAPNDSHAPACRLLPPPLLEAEADFVPAQAFLAALRRIETLEAQVASLQMAMPRGIPDHAPREAK